MPYPFFQVDAFTDTLFAGNPAAVFVLERPADARWMQLVAREMNLAETSFLRPRADGSFDLRWFTPAVEVDLCGHATLAAAHVLWETRRCSADAGIRFHTRSGQLGAVRDGDWIQLDFPSTPPTEIAPLDGLADALGAEPSRFLRTPFDLLVELPTAEQVCKLSPDLFKLKRFDARGVIITARGDESEPRFDFISRFFAPQVGVDEDPVTGSSHCALGPYWAARLGKNDLLAHQASARGGVIRVGVRGARVLLGGQAITVFCGEMR